MNNPVRIQFTNGRSAGLSSMNPLFRKRKKNVREVVDGDNGNIVQTINYYPFGMQYCDEGIDYSVQPYMYNGKEFDRVHGLNNYI